MSYCRWSSDDFQCDVYVYEDVYDGWATHVANFRRQYLSSLPPKLPNDAKFLAFVERQRTVMNAPYTMAPIGLPYDGESFYDPTPGDCAQRLRELKALGYSVPDYVIHELEEEESLNVQNNSPAAD